MEQLTLSFEPGLSKKHRSLRDCASTCIYGKGLERVACKIDAAPSNLSRALSDDPGRKLDVNDLEAYIEHFNDVTPVLYLVDKFLTDGKALNLEHLLAKADQQISDFQATVRQLKKGAGR